MSSGAEVVGTGLWFLSSSGWGVGVGKLGHISGGGAMGNSG